MFGDCGIPNTVERGAECVLMTQGVDRDFLWTGTVWLCRTYFSWSQNQPKPDIAQVITTSLPVAGVDFLATA
jgi:hypothetical protein